MKQIRQVKTEEQRGVMNILAVKQKFPFVSHDNKSVYGAVIPYEVEVEKGGPKISIGIGFTDLGQIYYVQFEGDDYPLNAEEVLNYIDINVKKGKNDVTYVCNFDETKVFAIYEDGDIKFIPNYNIFDSDEIPVLKEVLLEKCKYLNLLVDNEFEMSFEEFARLKQQGLIDDD